MIAASPRPHRFTVIVTLLATVALFSAGCGDNGSLSAASTSSSSTPASATSTDSSAPEVTPTTVVADSRTFIATVDPTLAAIEVYDSPGGARKQVDLDGDGADEDLSLPNPLPSGAPATFAIKSADQAAPGGALFHEVYLPVRPNGASGFVRADDVTVSHTDLAAQISLSNHTLTLTNAGTVIETFTVAVGAPDTPTPTGLFFVKELVEPTNADGAYGPLAYGLSAHSEVVLDTEAFADGVIGIHGTNREDLLGTDVSHGCVRLANDAVLRLEELAVPLGMPVRISA